jgi:hypothetical protein
MLFVSVSLNQVACSRASPGSNQGSLLATNQRASHCSGSASDERPLRSAVMMSTVAPSLCKAIADENSEQQDQAHEGRHNAFI